jgi:YidC/Oxa1 family membrane protein insertase
LIVYWITTNAWTMAQQFAIKTLMGPLPPPVGAEGVAIPAGPRAPEPGLRSDATGSREGRAGGLSGLLRGGAGLRAAREPVSAGERARATGGPPPSARKKKKRSGRRR